MKLRAHWKAYLVGAVVLVAALAVGGPFVYARWIAPEAAAPLSVGTTPSTRWRLPTPWGRARKPGTGSVSC